MNNDPRLALSYKWYKTGENCFMQKEYQRALEPYRRSCNILVKYLEKTYIKNDVDLEIIQEQLSKNYLRLGFCQHYLGKIKVRKF
jgi:hypothetical protein